MERFLPYQALIHTQGLTKKELPSEVQTLIKKIEATVRSVALVGKKNEQGDYIVTSNTQKKIDELDSKIVNLIWDYIDDKQRNEIRKSVPNPKEETKQVYADVTQEVKTEVKEQFKETKEEPKKEGSSGTIGFFDW